MANEPGVQGLEPIVVLLVGLFGALAGWVVGYSLDGIVQGRRLLAILAAISAVVLVTILRHVLSDLVPALAPVRPAARLPWPVWLSIIFSTLIGALAAYDLCEASALTSGWVVGFTSGTLAAVSMAVLMMLYFYRHPETGIEF
ncbi:hypothetical protein [Microvirga sp. M2]|uniref:hypothetical protein n=1 Tax=Microvirga sp. M2 TaxID=3073270 RepID=UPI0039C07AF7